MQDGYIFSWYIANNISLSDETTDDEKTWTCRGVRQPEWIHLKSAVGFQYAYRAGRAESAKDKKQRILIARAIYPNPEYLFFDEATNSLDASNERKIVENLNAFLKERRL